MGKYSNGGDKKAKQQYVVCQQCPGSWIFSKYIANSPHCKYCGTQWPSVPPWAVKPPAAAAADPPLGAAGLEHFLDQQRHPSIWETSFNGPKIAAAEFWKQFWVVVKECKEQSLPHITLEQLLDNLEAELKERTPEPQLGLDSDKASKNFNSAKIKERTANTKHEKAQLQRKQAQAVLDQAVTAEEEAKETLEQATVAVEAASAEMHQALLRENRKLQPPPQRPAPADGEKAKTEELLSSVPELQASFLEDLQLEEDDTELPADWEDQLSEAKKSSNDLQSKVSEMQKQIEQAKKDYQKTIDDAAKKIREDKQNLLSKAEKAGKKARKGAGPQEQLASMSASSQLLSKAEQSDETAAMDIGDKEDKNKDNAKKPEDRMFGKCVDIAARAKAGRAQPYRAAPVHAFRG